MAPGRPGCHFKTAIFNLVLLISVFTLSYDNALRWMPWDLTDDKSILVQVMAWCRQATSHYRSQCRPSSMSPYGITRPQWVKGPHHFYKKNPVLDVSPFRWPEMWQTFSCHDVFMFGKSTRRLIRHNPNLTHIPRGKHLWRQAHQNKWTCILNASSTFVFKKKV